LPSELGGEGRHSAQGEQVLVRRSRRQQDNGKNELARRQGPENGDRRVGGEQVEDNVRSHRDGGEEPNLPGSAIADQAEGDESGNPTVVAKPTECVGPRWLMSKEQVEVRCDRSEQERADHGRPVNVPRRARQGRAGGEVPDRSHVSRGLAGTRRAPLGGRLPWGLQ